MAYCTAADCRIYARHPDLATCDFVASITHASGEFDAMMRGAFEVPLAVVDQVVKNIVAMWAAGFELLTRRAIAGSKSEYAEQLIADAKAKAKEILANPSMISVPLRTSAVDGQDKLTVLVTEGKRVFDMGWGE